MQLLFGGGLDLVLGFEHSDFSDLGWLRVVRWMESSGFLGVGCFGYRMWSVGLDGFCRSWYAFASGWMRWSFVGDFDILVTKFWLRTRDLKVRGRMGFIVCCCRLI